MSESKRPRETMPGGDDQLGGQYVDGARVPDPVVEEDVTDA
jgi:hypothetical protein